MNKIKILTAGGSGANVNGKEQSDVIVVFSQKEEEECELRLEA